MDAQLLKTMDVIFDDTFEAAGVPWEIVGGAPTLARTVADGEWLDKGAGLKLTTSTVSAEVAQIRRYLNRQPNYRRFVFGARFAVNDENPLSIEFNLGFRDGVDYFQSRLVHVYASDLWQYDTGGAGAQNLVTLLTRDASESPTVARWHEVVVSAVFDTKKYAGLKIDENDYANTVSGVAMRQTAGATLPGEVDLGVIVTNITGVPVAGVVLLDELYLLASA